MQIDLAPVMQTARGGGGGGGFDYGRVDYGGVDCGGFDDTTGSGGGDLLVTAQSSAAYANAPDLTAPRSTFRFV